MERQAPARPYDGRLRQEQARATQQRIVDAARDLFVDRGYGATTVADVAARAGVSVPTVYKSFATKGALAERAYPAGDDTAMAAASSDDDDPRRVLQRFASTWRDELERSGAIAAAVGAGATAGDSELRALAARRDRERLRTTGTVARHLAAAGALRRDLSVEKARDILWFLGAPETHLLLVERRGWSYAQLERWLTEAMTAALLERDSETTTSG